MAAPGTVGLTLAGDVLQLLVSHAQAPIQRLVYEGLLANGGALALRLEAELARTRRDPFVGTCPEARSALVAGVVASYVGHLLGHEIGAARTALDEARTGIITKMTNTP